MSRLSDAHFHGGFPSAPRRVEPYRRITLAFAVIAAAAAGFAIGHDALSVRVAQAAGPDLVRLLRFMAAVKGVLALGAVAVAWWRLGYPASARLAMAAITACALMAAGCGVVWCMAHIVLGSALFYAGLLSLVALGYVDRDEVHDAASNLRLAIQRRETATAASVRRNGGSVQGGS